MLLWLWFQTNNLCSARLATFMFYKVKLLFMSMESGGVIQQLLLVGEKGSYSYKSLLWNIWPEPVSGKNMHLLKQKWYRNYPLICDKTETTAWLQNFVFHHLTWNFPLKCKNPPKKTQTTKNITDDSDDSGITCSSMLDQ